MLAAPCGEHPAKKTDQPMNKYLASGLCLLALHTSAQALTLPASPVTAPAVDDEHIDLKTPTTAG